MTISFIAGDSAAADTIALPSLTVGDIILGIAQDTSASAVTITVPGTWWQHNVSGTSAGRSRAYGVKTYDGTAFSFGTWTNADKVSYLIFRSNIGLVYPMNVGTGSSVGTGTSLAHPTVNSNVFSASLNNCRVLLVASSSVNGVGEEAAISGFTQIHRSTLASNDLVCDLSNSTLGSFASITRTLSVASNTFGSSIVLTELPFSIPSGGGDYTFDQVKQLRYRMRQGNLV